MFTRISHALLLGAIGTALTALAPQAQASSHREALAVLNEPCADTTDIYAWVSDGAHDKLYLAANFLPLHEPGQGNQGLRACDGYRYEFHIGKGTSLADRYVYRIEYKLGAPTDNTPAANEAPLGGNELLWQITGGTETYSVTRIDSVTGAQTVLASNLKVAPNNHGPQTDRLAYGLGPFEGYESGRNASRSVGLYDDAFIASNFIHRLSNGGRAFSGQRDDPFYLDEKGIFDLVNLCAKGLGNAPGARTTPCEDVFTGFNVFNVSLEIPISDIFPEGIPHNGQLIGDSTDSLLRVWFGVSRQQIQYVNPDNVVRGVDYSGDWVQVGRQALPLFNAGLVGTARQTKYLRTNPMRDVTNFGADVLFPVLVRDAKLLGIYRAFNVDADALGLTGPRLDIINAINLGRPIPIADGSTGDVITIDAAVNSAFPNGRRLGYAPGGARNREQVDVSDVLISLIIAGAPGLIGDGVNSNDKDYLPDFPFAAAPHQGVDGGHGGTNGG